MTEISDNAQIGEVCLPTADLNVDLPFYTKQLGFRLEEIFPADDPAVAVFSGYGMRIRLEKHSDHAPGTLILRCKDPTAVAQPLTAPNGTIIKLVVANPPLEIPPTQHSFSVRRLTDEQPWIIGRAGMHYRDLIPARLGGSIIASHIRIPDGGPVPDMVHYHTVGFQLIFCYRGWVKLVYEDQGPPFFLRAGDCVTQPPKIRHRVLEASDNVEVIEIGVPAEHVTTIDHEMELPNDIIRPDRVFDGQTFCHHQVEKAQWEPWRLTGFEMRDTGIGKATGQVASVQVARPLSGTQHSLTTKHTSDILFTFVMEGSLTLQGEGQSPHALARGDAYVIPPDMLTTLRDCSEDLELLEVSLPAAFDTIENTEA